MTLTPEGGAAIPVSVTTTRKVQGGSAIPVYGYMTAPTDGRPAMGGSAIPVRVLTAADLKENGGMWTLEGRPHAMPVYTAPAGAVVQGGPAIAVYPVNAWPTVPVTPPVTPWYLSGGIAAAGVRAAYQSVAAASYAASKSNLANPGTYDAADGAAFPSWTAANGWRFTAASSQFLTVTGMPAETGAFSIIIRINLVTSPDFAMLVTRDAAGVDVKWEFSSRLDILPNGPYFARNVTINQFTTILSTATEYILAVTIGAVGGCRSYVDGTLDQPNATPTSFPTATTGVLRIGERSDGYFTNGYIKALALYQVELTPAQVSAVGTAAAAL